MFYFQWLRFFDDSPFSAQKLQAAPPSGVAPILPSPTRPTPRARAPLGPTRSSKTMPSSASACARPLMHMIQPHCETCKRVKVGQDMLRIVTITFVIFGTFWNLHVWHRLADFRSVEAFKQRRDYLALQVEVLARCSAFDFHRKTLALWVPSYGLNMF